MTITPFREIRVTSLAMGLRHGASLGGLHTSSINSTLKSLGGGELRKIGELEGRFEVCQVGCFPQY